METEKVSILIIGSGPAGYTAAIYAARANMKPLLYQGIQPGGQLTITTDVENYPGFPDGIQGPEMMVNFEKQAARMGTDIRYGLATKVDFSGAVKKVWIDDEKIIEADAVIISTGASAKWLGIPSEERLNGFGVNIAFSLNFCAILLIICLAKTISSAIFKAWLYLSDISYWPGLTSW